MKKNKKIKKICVIGGGPAGLTAAYKLAQNGQKVSENFSYSSNNNIEWITKLELKKWINFNKKLF